MILGVVVPTVDGREGYLRRAIATHGARPFPFATKVVVRVVRGMPTCGDAWNAGARALREAFGRELGYLCFTADDLEARPGWAEAAIAAWESDHVLPAPVLYVETPAGELVDPRTIDPDPPLFSRVPFLPFDLWVELGPCPSLHYYSDVFYGRRATELGIGFRTVPAFSFVHRWAQEGRLSDDGRDRELLERVLSGA